MLSLVSRYVTPAAVIVLSVMVVAGTAMAQAQQPVPSPFPPGGAPPAPSARKAPAMGTLEGSVKKVDPAAGTVQVSSGPLGILRKTLEVTNDTQIQMEGRQATLADLREGATVKASYETREGKNVAKEIEVVSAPDSQKGATGQMRDKSPSGQTPDQKSPSGQMPGKRQ